MLEIEVQSIIRILMFPVEPITGDVSRLTFVWSENRTSFVTCGGARCLAGCSEHWLMQVAVEYVWGASRVLQQDCRM